MLKRISELIETRGREYLDKLLSGEVIITEKIDVFRILFENKKGEIIFYKKDNTPITLIERTLNDTWEKALLEIPSIVDNVKIPEGIRFGIQYTPIERPLRIPYTNLPRYILSDVTKRHGKNKVVESFDYKEVTKWAGMLCMARPPVIFSGKLNEEQKKKLIDYDTKNYNGDELSFSEMIDDMFGSTYSKQDIIEGIVIKSKDNKLVQVVSYEFELLDEAYKNSNISRDFYDIILLSLNSFMEDYNLPILEFESKEEMYLNIVCDIFNKYCETNNVNETMEIKYLTPPQYGHIGNLNKRFIKNKTTLKILKKSSIHEALFRVILSSFRKFKKPYGLLTEKVVEKFNTYVYLIAERIKEEIDTLDERFENLNEQQSKNVAINALKRRQPTDVDNMRVISSIQKAFQPLGNNVPRGEDKCAVYLTTYLPFTSAQMRNIEEINQKWNVPIVLAAISNKNNISGKEFHLSDETVINEMKSLSNFDKNLMPSVMMLDSWNLVEIFEYCRPRFEPLLIITDIGKKSELSLQLFFEEEIMGGRMNVEPEFNIGEMENNESFQGFRSIEDGNGSMFMEITPKSIHNLYDTIISEYNTWNGTIPLQFKENKY